MSERRAVGLVVLVLLGLVVAPAAGASAATPSSLGGGFTAQTDFERTTFGIEVFENGSARWTFQYTQPLANDSQRENFRAFASDFNENSTELYQNFQTRSEQLTATGTNATGREMDATAFSKRAYVAGPSGNQGVVQMSFTWTNFAVVEGQQVTVGDVFQGGLYLAENQRLRIEHGPNLEFHSDVDPGPDDMSGPTIVESQSLTWEGERQFNDEKPRVEMGPPGSGDPGGDGLGLSAMFALALVLLLGIGAAVAWRTDLFGDGDDAAPVSPDDGESPAATGTEDEAGPSGEVASEPAVPDEELLSDEDRVLHLLEENGGRMKQVNIVEETGWSKSKVSMLLSDMEDAEQISKLRVGRENVISLKGHEPDAARSPFEDE